MLVLIFLLSAILSFGQGEGFRACHTSIEQGWYSAGIFFRPLSEEHDLKDNTVCFLDSLPGDYFLNDMAIPIKTLAELKISSHQLSNDQTKMFTRNNTNAGYGTFAYLYEANDDCPTKIIFKLDTDLPIYLNGELLVSDKNSLKDIDVKRIVSIEKTWALFGGYRIYIKLKSETTSNL